MVLLIVILAALAFIFVLIFAAKALKGEKSRPPAAASVPTTKQKPLQRVSTTAASSQSSSASSVLHKEIRQYLINGVSLIFDEKAPANDMSLIPRTLEQIDPQVLETVSEHLARMDQFRIRQARLEKYLNDPAVQMADLSKGITSDPLMTAKILKMVNSSYFGMPQKVDSISHAPMILGMQNVKNIVFRDGMRSLFDTGSRKTRQRVMEACQSGECLHATFLTFCRTEPGNTLYLGIVHDIGKLLLMEISHHLPGGRGREGEYTMDFNYRGGSALRHQPRAHRGYALRH